jgi:hypothetical protein
LFNLTLGLGTFDKAKSGIYIDGAQNTTAVAELRTEVSCPKEVNFFAVAEFGLKSGYSDEQVGELAGIIDTLVGSIPWNKLPIQAYHSHSGWTRGFFPSSLLWLI